MATQRHAVDYCSHVFGCYMVLQSPTTSQNRHPRRTRHTTDIASDRNFDVKMAPYWAPPTHRIV